MSIKILHTGDPHVDTTTHGEINRLTGMNKAMESNRDALASAVQHGIDQDVDAFLIAGDMYANGRPSQEAVLVAYETLLPIVKKGTPTILIGGNHERLQVPTTHRTATDTLGAMLSPHGQVHVIERTPQLIRVGDGIQLACFPWLSKTSVLSRLGIEQADPEMGDRAVVQYALDELEKMCDEADTSSPLIFSAHVTVDDVRLDNVAKGHKRGSEVDIASLFAEPVLPRKALQDSPVSYAGLSHIHARQRMGTKCYYAGAPNRFTFTDADDPKSVNLVTISDDNTLESVDYLETKARLMHRIVLDSADASDKLANLEEGALVETVLPAGEGTLDDNVRAQILNAGASVAAVKTTPTEIVRSNAITLPETVTPVQALRTWMDEKHPDHDATRVVSAASALMEDIEL